MYSNSMHVGEGFFFLYITMLLLVLLQEEMGSPVLIILKIFSQVISIIQMVTFEKLDFLKSTRLKLSPIKFKDEGCLLN